MPYLIDAMPYLIHDTRDITCNTSYMTCPHYSLSNMPSLLAIQHALTTRYATCPHYSLSNMPSILSHTFIPHTFIAYIPISIHLHLSSSMRGQSRMGATSHLNESKPFGHLRIHTHVYLSMHIYVYQYIYHEIYIYICVHIYRHIFIDIHIYIEDMCVFVTVKTRACGLGDSGTFWSCGWR